MTDAEQPKPAEPEQPESPAEPSAEPPAAPPKRPRFVHNRKPPDEKAIRLGSWLRARRAKLDISLRDAAKVADCSDPWLCQLESGYTSLASVRVENIRKVAAAYRLNIFTLLQTLRVLTPKEATIAREMLAHWHELGLEVSMAAGTANPDGSPKNPDGS